MLDVRRALEYLTDDERAQTKLGIGALLMLVPLANVAAVGYEVEVARRVARNEARPLPEWNDLGGLFVTGAWLSLAQLVYMLPVFGGMLAMMLVAFALAVQFAQSSQPNVPAGPIFVLALVGSVVILMLYSLLFGFLSPAILAQYAQRGTFGACFDLGAIVRFIQRDPGHYALAWLAELAFGLVIGLLAAAVGIVLGAIPCLGSIAIMFVAGITGFVLLMFNSHLVGQLMQAGANTVST